MMEEPMDEGQSSEPTNGGQNEAAEEKKSKVSSILRPGSMVMMTITVEDYESQYWPRLQNAINQLLTMKPGDYIPISYEQMYSCVYKCVCKQFSERLYGDLLELISGHLENLAIDLQNQDCMSFQFLENFHFAMNQYLQALGGIVPIFNYMNRFYVETKLKTDLNKELRTLFVTFVAEKHIERIIPLLVEASAKPFAVSPPTMAELIRNLHDLKPGFSALHPCLFARYIPNILPPSRPEDLDKYIEEAKQMQRDLRSHPDFTVGDQGRKRSGEDDQPKPSSLSYLPKNHNT